MSATLRAIPTLARIALAEHLASPFEIAIWILTSSLPLFMLALWDTVVQDGAIEGFGPTEMARYFVATLIVRQLTGAWVVWELAFSIRTGRLSGQLLRPIHPLTVWAVWMVTALPFRALVLMPLVGALALWRPEAVTLPALPIFGLALISITLAFCTNYLVQCWFGTLAFWMDKSDGAFGLWFALWILLSGYVAPTALFPDAVQPLIHWLPFRGLLAVPVELLGGFMTPEQAASELALQVGWMLVWAWLVAVTWRRGLVRYGAFGA